SDHNVALRCVSAYSRRLVFSQLLSRCSLWLIHYAPYLLSRRALARASVIRYLASNWPRPPRRHSLSPNFSQPSVRQNLAERSVGTGCQLWLASMLGVLWSPVTISTSGLSALMRGTAASNSSMRFTFAAKLPSSPVLSVYLKWIKKKSYFDQFSSSTVICSASVWALPMMSMPTSRARPLYIGYTAMAAAFRPYTSS